MERVSLSVSQAPVADGSRSLEDIHGTVAIPRAWWRRFLAFSGPALLISVGYMDPGNWATDLQAGSKYGYRLLWVLLVSNLMALLLQTLATRLGVVAGRDLAQACREEYPRRTVFGLWLLTEIAIAATDLAEVIGTIIALKLLFDFPYLWGLAIAAADTFLLLALQRRGIRPLELVTLALIAIIGSSFVFELILARPDWAAAARGLVPGFAADLGGSLTVAVAMLGATVMPHNLYLHSALVQTRAFSQTPRGKRLACRYNFFDSALALNVAFFINAAILVLAAASFYGGKTVESLQEAYHLLGIVWGTTAASILFAVALLASGQSSTLTGTLAGQVVMEGFVRLRLRPWVRRLVTRSLALAPAIVVLALASAGSTPLSAGEPDPADGRLLEMLVLSQVVLGFQLPFAIVPLIQFTSDRRRMGDFASGPFLKALAWICALAVVSLNAAAITMQMNDWAEEAEKAGWNPAWIYGTLGPLGGVVALFLGWVAAYPWFRRPGATAGPAPVVLPTVPQLAAVHYRHVGVAVEFTPGDGPVLAQAAALARANNAALLIIHVVEGVGASYYGSDTDNQESRSDREALAHLLASLSEGGLQAEGVLGYGSPAQELVRLAVERRLDLLVLGTHGHRFLADLALGETVGPVLHRLGIPVLVVPPAWRSEGVRET
jgi:manganese transport protein